MIFGFAFLLLIGGVVLFLTQSRDQNTEVAAKRISSVGNDIVEQASQIYSYGRGSKTTVYFTMPDNVLNITVTHNNTAVTGTELVVTMNTQSKNHSLVYFSDYQMFIGNCTDVKDLPYDFVTKPGKKEIVVTSCGTNISIYSRE
ncbi:MAG TPA: hypothetical protein VK158_00310 [Acidobacteriota bacterium]|nr:hypothetical protein [Acidobacteriota bacterium]